MNIYDATEQAYKNGYQQGKRDAVKHGRWINEVELLYGWIPMNSVVCSACHEANGLGTAYCPNCGAQMDLPEPYDPDIPRDQCKDKARFD